MQKSSLFIFLFLTTAVFAQHDDWKKINQRPLPQWYRDAKLGIFIHWGVYSVPAWATLSGADGFGSNYAEWYWQRLSTPSLKIHKEFRTFHEKNYGPHTQYQDLAPLFKAELFDAEKWAEILSLSGAKYVVLTSKHHDGFCLWPSHQSWNWNSVDIGPHRDFVKEISIAVRKKNMRMGYYYSLYEWYHPLYLDNVKNYVDQHMLPQLKDLVNTYQPDILWADGDWEQTASTWQSSAFIEWLYFQSPVKEQIITNDRWGSDVKNYFKSGVITTEYGRGNLEPGKVWEECRGIGASFGYNRNENLEQYASSEELVHTLIRTVANGGNLLLNIGPAADGTIPVIMQQRLKDLGDWLKINGEAIFQTRQRTLADSTQTYPYFTSKHDVDYLLITKWEEQITISSKRPIKQISLLGSTEAVSFTMGGQHTIKIKAPVIHPGNIPCLYAWVYKIEYR